MSILVSSMKNGSESPMVSPAMQAPPPPHTCSASDASLHDAQLDWGRGRRQWLSTQVRMQVWAGLQEHKIHSITKVGCSGWHTDYRCNSEDEEVNRRSDHCSTARCGWEWSPC